MEWTVVTVIVALVGLFFTIGKPVLDLNANIVKLNLSLDALNKRADKQERDLEAHVENSHESHKRIWDHSVEQDKRLDDHEHRISRLEGHEEVK